MRARVPVLSALLLPVLLLSSACGGDDGAITASKSTTTEASGDRSLDQDACEAMAAAEPPENLADLVPAEYRAAAEAVLQFTTAMDDADLDSGEPSTASPAAEELADALGEPGVGDGLVALGELVATECAEDDAAEAAQAMSYLGGAAALVAEDAEAEYCSRLEALFATDSGSAPADPAVISGLQDVAPESHADALELLAQVTAEEDAPEGDLAQQTASAFVGLGLYAEARCDVPGAFAQMMVAAAFLTMGDSLGGGSDEGSGDTDGSGGETGTEPDEADAKAATAVLPDGVDLEFEAVRVDLEEDGDYLASIVAPAGWTQDTSFNVSFEPPDGGPFGFFTSLEVGAGCDGLCEATDWEARLRGAEGWLTTRLDGWTIGEERAPGGSEGVALTATKDDGSALAVVVRWDDDADRYFQCEAELDADDAALAPAMLAACEASRPGWIPVG